MLFLVGHLKSLLSTHKLARNTGCTNRWEDFAGCCVDTSGGISMVRMKQPPWTPPSKDEAHAHTRYTHTQGGRLHAHTEAKMWHKRGEAVCGLSEAPGMVRSQEKKTKLVAGTSMVALSFATCAIDGNRFDILLNSFGHPSFNVNFCRANQSISLLIWVVSSLGELRMNFLILQYHEAKSFRFQDCHWLQGKCGYD